MHVLLHVIALCVHVTVSTYSVLIKLVVNTCLARLRNSFLRNSLKSTIHRAGGGKPELELRESKSS